MTVFARDIMNAPVQVVSPDATVAHARNLMVRHHISRLPVMENGALVGILTKKDIAYRMRQGEPAWRRRPLDRIPVGALMTENPVVVQPDTGVKEIARIFTRRNFSSVPVVDERGYGRHHYQDGSDEIRPCPADHLAGRGRDGGCTGRSAATIRSTT